MNIINLPTERAVEPNEEARQPEVHREEYHSVNFVETPAHDTENTNANKNFLSQPPRSITHKEKLLWLQQRRTEGLWVQCDDCDRWRYLPQVLDCHALPAKWYCWMNPDISLATCTAAETPICLYDEDDLIHAEYAAGSVVIARMPGFPWWPAMVCDCPDTEQYYWLDGFSDIPTHYNVVFFDAYDATRAWMAPEQLMPYKNNSKLLTKSLKVNKYKNRLEIAITQANDAETLTLSNRLVKYSFIARFNGKIMTPKKIKSQEIIRYRNMLKRKFNILALSEESLSSDEEVNNADKNKIKKKTTTKQKKIVWEKNPNTRSQVISETTAGNLTNSTNLSSLAVQIDSDLGLIKSSEVSNDYYDREINTIKDSLECKNLQTRETNNTLLTEDSEKSDNFDF